MSGVLAGIFDEITMTRDVRLPRVPPAFDAAGDPIYDTEQQEQIAVVDNIMGGMGRASPGALRAREEAAAATNLTPVVASCIAPLTAPLSVQPGVEFRLPWRGVPSILRVTTRDDENLPALAAAFGTTLYGVIRPVGRAGGSGSGSGEASG